MPEPTTRGRSSPLGATVSREGTNFSVYSKHATGIELLLFDHADDACPSSVIRLDPALNRTYHYWHVFARGVPAGQIYGYRVSGALDPANGMRFDNRKLLLDPYGLAAGSTPLSTHRRILFTGKLLYQPLHPPYGRKPGR